MNTIPHPGIKTARRLGSSPKQRKAEQAIRDATKRRMDSLWRATRGRGWSAHHLFLARIMWALEARALAKLNQP